VKQLPEEIRAQLHELLRNGGVEQQQILAEVNQLIEEAGLPEDLQLSRSGLNRYATQMESYGREMREMREVTESWIARFGDRPTGEVSKFLIETIRTQYFRLLMKGATDPDALLDPEALGELALGIQRLERAAMLTHDREKDLRKEFAAEAAEAAEKKMVSQGMSRETVDKIKREILGIA
jgi:hypothetical protein